MTTQSLSNYSQYGIPAYRNPPSPALPGAAAIQTIATQTFAKAHSVRASELQMHNAAVTFRALSQNPHSFFLALDELSQYAPSLSSHGLQDLSLCECPKLVSSARAFLEEQTLELLGDSRKKRSLLTIVSVGPGLCYQELVYLAKCANAGYTRIQLVLIDTEEVPLKALKEACRTYLSKHCNINLVYYPSLESYHEVAATRRDKKPDLFLMLDLTDEECGIHELQFPDYCFQFFNQHNLMKENTVIAHSDSWTNEKNELFSVASCGIHDGTTQTLSDLADKREYLTKVDESRLPFLQ